MMRRLFNLALAWLMALHAYASPVVIDFFGEADCFDCEEVKRDVLPLLQPHAGQYEIRFHDINEKTNYLKLVQFQESLNITESENVCMVVDGAHPLNGLTVIRTGLVSTVKASIANGQFQIAKASSLEEQGKTDSQSQMVDGVLVKRAATWTPWVVAAVGLVDGLNPCAISTLVFLVSLLAVGQVRGGRLIGFAASFTVASFTTYLLLGFGLLRVFHSLPVYPWLKDGLEYGMLVVLIVMAGVSFKDANRYRVSRSPDDVTFKLPEKIQALSHRLMKKGVSSASVIVSGFLIGCVVTLLESVCTGQVYVPTLVLILKNGFDAHAWGLLILYNLLFILPLVVAFVLTYAGYRTSFFINWSKKNVVLSKCLMGVLFLVLGGIIVIL